MTDLPVVLGTSSKFRQRLFSENFDTPFTTASPEIDEKAITAGYTNRQQADPTALTLAVAHAKADALRATLPPCVLITSDQVVTHDGEIREKPTSEAQCRGFLASYARKPLTTVTALVVVDTRSGRVFEGVDIASVFFSPFPDSVIDALVSRGEVMHCAGGITAESELLAPYRTHLDGEFESIQGLPITLLRRLLDRVCASG